MAARGARSRFQDAHPVASEAEHGRRWVECAGATCASKLVFRERDTFSGRWRLEATPRRTRTGRRAGCSSTQPLRDQQYPLTWLYHDRGLQRQALVVSAEDTESLQPDTQDAGRVLDDPGKPARAVPKGGHNDRNYRTWMRCGGSGRGLRSAEGRCAAQMLRAHGCRLFRQGSGPDLMDTVDSDRLPAPTSRHKRRSHAWTRPLATSTLC